MDNPIIKIGTKQTDKIKLGTNHTAVIKLGDKPGSIPADKIPDGDEVSY